MAEKQICEMELTAGRAKESRDSGCCGFYSKALQCLKNLVFLDLSQSDPSWRKSGLFI